MQQKKTFFAYALATGLVGILLATSATPGFARQARKTMYDGSYQVQSAASSYAYAPQTLSMAGRRGQCWIATDANRPYGYMDTCANPLAHDPALNPTYNGVLHGE
ncbi:MAG TPA: hypothetical protein VIV34_06920 [Pseudolabrys sp.]